MSQITLDGSAGAGETFQGLGLTGVVSFTFDAQGMLAVTLESGVVQNYDISTAATVTVTVAGVGNYTVVIAD